jgi:hypothetical protein
VMRTRPFPLATSSPHRPWGVQANGVMTALSNRCFGRTFLMSQSRLQHALLRLAPKAKCLRVRSTNLRNALARSPPPLDELKDEGS